LRWNSFNRSPLEGIDQTTCEPVLSDNHPVLSDKMNTISLRTLLRDPRQVKRMTRTGQPVRVTHNPRPLWIIHPAAGTNEDEAKRRRAIDEILDEVLCERPSTISAAKLLDESRR
jgi:hypothetical protein